MSVFSQNHLSTISDKINQGSILYHILNHERHLPSCSCSCESKEKVMLESPYVTCKAASEVLLKTVNFIKNLPSFHGLLQQDQFLLLENCWAPLFVLGLAQEGVDFEVTEPKTSILKEILMNQKSRNYHEKMCSQLSAAEVQKVKSFLTKCWSIDISTKEYVYLKGIILFTPDVSGLGSPQYILCLQQEAELALTDYIHSLHPQDKTRFSQILFALTSLKTINAHIITELFFRPLIGNVQMNALLMEITGGYFMC
uniref:NR LBD domain-containing protein n=1 Tax=Callorhinchus milii TaxID=7868 RepID=A0A4W3HGW6_CALMI